MSKCVIALVGFFSLLGWIVSACIAAQVASETPAAVAEKPGSALSGRPAWEQDWERTLGEAKKEGKVVLYSAYGVEFREPLVEAMSQKYGITVESMSMTGPEIAERVMREQRLGLHTADVQVSGISQFILSYKPEGAVEPLEKVLILPEAIDPRNWWGGRFPWVDRDTKSYVEFFNYVSVPIIVNTDFLKPEELKSWKDLLNPKWKGRILLNDPTIAGSSQKLFSVFAYGKIMSVDFVRELVKQEPALQRDTRLQSEWVARGKFPIGIGAHTDEALRFKSLGAPLVFIIPQEGSYAVSGNGCVALLKKAPHPNAAKVFLNFLLSKEGQTIASRATKLQSGRTDVPTDHMESIMVRKPGIQYMSTSDPDFMAAELKLKEEVKAIFAPLLK